MKRLLQGMATAAIILAILNVTVIGLALSSHIGIGGIEMISVLPATVILVCVALAIHTLRTQDLRRSVIGFALTGAFVGGFLFLVLQAAMVLPNYGLVSSDGTAYWGMVSLPSLYVGIPLLVFGFLAGAAGHFSKTAG